MYANEGVEKQNSFASTSAMSGQFRKSSETRSEFFNYKQKFCLMRTFDLAVLGGGPGGYVAAIRLLKLVKKYASLIRISLEEFVLIGAAFLQRVY